MLHTKQEDAMEIRTGKPKKTRHCVSFGHVSWENNGVFSILVVDLTELDELD